MDERNVVINSKGDDAYVPVHSPRVGESANKCAARLGLRLLGRRETPTDSNPVIACVESYRAVEASNENG